MLPQKSVSVQILGGGGRGRKEIPASLGNTYKYTFSGHFLTLFSPEVKQSVNVFKGDFTKPNMSHNLVFYMCGLEPIRFVVARVVYTGLDNITGKCRMFLCLHPAL